MNMHIGDVVLILVGTVILFFGISLMSLGVAGLWLVDVCIVLSFPLFVMALMGFFEGRAFDKRIAEVDRQKAEFRALQMEVKE